MRGESVARCQHGVLTPTRLMTSESRVESSRLVQEWTCRQGAHLQYTEAS